MARRKSRRLRFLWLGWGAVSAPVKLVALGLVAVLVGGVAADGLLGLPAGGGLGYAHGPAQRWGSASSADARTAGNASRNHTLPDTLRSRYPAVKWQQNAGSVGTPPAPATTGFDPATSRELPEARTANERTYANTDGTETTEFSTVPVNYRTPQGWAPIDTALTADGGSGWRNTADSAGLHFAPTSADQFATMTPEPGRQVSFGLDGASAVAGTVNGSAITYPGVRPHVDLKLEAKPGGVKETLVLGSAAAPTSYVFPLRLNGLTPHLDNGQVVLTDAAGATKAVIPAGDMVDAGAARSAGVTYRLVTSGGGPALEVTLDAGWLRDPARHYPVQVDPTVHLPVNGGAADDAMYVQEGVGSAKGDQDLLVGTVNGHNSASYIKFSSLVGKLQYHTIFGAQLWLTEYNSDSCKPRELTVNPVTGSWSGGSGYSYPGPAVGGSLASKSFAHGYIAFGHSSSDCPTAGETINLGAAGRDLVQRWVDGTQANYGLSLRGSTDSLSGKWFTGTATANPPKLYVTHSPYNATYSIPNPVPNPAVLQNQDGKIKVSVTNKSAAAWAPGDYYLAYRAYNTATGASVTQQRSANLTSTVARGGRVTLDATIKALPPGKYFLDFTMVKTGGPVFTDHQVPPGRLVLQVFDIPPVVQELYPPNGYQAQTLTPQLWARALDIDAPPGSSLQFKFQVCLRDDSGNPVNCTDSGYQAKQAWTVPAGTLSWTKAYMWRAYVKDANNEVNSPYSTILTSVPQPDITSHLAGDQKQAFDPVVGNYSTAAVDATIVTVGPQLSLSRTYNSLDPRRDGLFGAGWSTTYDMKLVPDNDGSRQRRGDLSGRSAGPLRQERRRQLRRARRAYRVADCGLDVLEAPGQVRHDVSVLAGRPPEPDDRQRGARRRPDLRHQHRKAVQGAGFQQRDQHRGARAELLLDRQPRLLDPDRRGQRCSAELGVHLHHRRAEDGVRTGLGLHELRLHGRFALPECRAGLASRVVLAAWRTRRHFGGQRDLGQPRQGRRHVRQRHARHGRSARRFDGHRGVLQRHDVLGEPAEGHAEEEP